MNQIKACCFSGHRKLPAEKIEAIVKRLNIEIDRLIAQGVMNFMSGGALGFDQIAASMIIAKKEMGYPVRLILALPCRNQDAYWSPAQQRLYQALLLEADGVRYISEEYSDDCMKKRNHYMVEHSDHCICALLHNAGGTAHTVRYAQKRGPGVFNTAD